MYLLTLQMKPMDEKTKKERKVLFPVSTVTYLKIWIAGSIDPFWLVSTAQPAKWVGGSCFCGRTQSDPFSN